MIQRGRLLFRDAMLEAVSSPDRIQARTVSDDTDSCLATSGGVSVSREGLWRTGSQALRQYSASFFDGCHDALHLARCYGFGHASECGFPLDLGQDPAAVLGNLLPVSLVRGRHRCAESF
jgi:hypothetical protein